MRISVAIGGALFLFLINSTGCRQCECCGPINITVTCTKDTVQIERVFGGAPSTAVAQANDTVNYYSNLGYSCSEVGANGPNFGALNTYLVCGRKSIQANEAAGDICESESNCP